MVPTGWQWGGEGCWQSPGQERGGKALRRPRTGWNWGVLWVKSSSERSRNQGAVTVTGSTWRLHVRRWVFRGAWSSNTCHVLLQNFYMCICRYTYINTHLPICVIYSDTVFIWHMMSLIMPQNLVFHEWALVSSYLISDVFLQVSFWPRASLIKKKEWLDFLGLL